MGLNRPQPDLDGHGPQARYSPGGGLLTDRAEIGSGLAECCLSSVPATVIVTNSHRVFPARFVSLSSYDISFDLFSEGDAHVEPLDVCCVSYLHKGLSSIFLSTVLHWHEAEPGRPPRLQLDLPKVVAWTEPRRAFRVPVVAGCGLEVRIQVDGVWRWNALPLDVSFGGVLLEFPPEACPDLAIGAEITLELRLGRDCSQYLGVVRHRSGTRFGIFFPETMRGDEIQPPEVLRNIIRVLENAWFQTRWAERSR